MNLNLTKPIVFFDLETTGINIATDRIVEIAVLKVFPNGNKESKTWLVNPEMPIPSVVTAIHGITDEKVANEPTFNELAKEVHSWIKDSDLGGFNSNRFDIPLLAEEMLRAGVDFDMKNCRSRSHETQQPRTCRCCRCCRRWLSSTCCSFCKRAKLTSNWHCR